jgi:hypothetical protein
MPNQTPKPNTNKPAHEIRLAGIRATIWKNDTDKGPRFNTTFERSYLEGEEWKSSNAFGRDDLLTLGFVAAEALRWIMTQKPPAQSGVQR